MYPGPQNIPMEGKWLSLTATYKARNDLRAKSTQVVEVEESIPLQYVPGITCIQGMHPCPALQQCPQEVQKKYRDIARWEMKLAVLDAGSGNLWSMSHTQVQEEPRESVRVCSAAFSQWLVWSDNDHSGEAYMATDHFPQMTEPHTGNQILLCHLVQLH